MITRFFDLTNFKLFSEISWLLLIFQEEGEEGLPLVLNIKVQNRHWNIRLFN